MTIESVLNVTCSKALNKESLPVDCNLLDELMSDKYQLQQNEVRTESDPVRQNELKMKMPVLLPSGTFKGAKGAKNLVKHSGVIAIDIDFKDNQDVTNFTDFKNEIRKIPEVAYCGLSIRGKGYFLIIPIAYPEKHELHFKFIENFFKKKGLIIDQTCKNVNRLRYYSYDPDAYYKHDAKLLKAYYKPPENQATNYYKKVNNGLKLAGNVYENAMVWVKSKDVIFEDGKKHEYIFLLCSYLASQGVEKKDAEKWIDENLMPLTKITSNCIESPFAKYKAENEIEAKPQPEIINKPKLLNPKMDSLPQPKQLPQPEPQPQNCTLQRYKAMAIKDYSKTLIKDRITFKNTYMELWFDGMKTILQPTGITKNDFVNFI
jgi:hypothetical protein